MCWYTYPEPHILLSKVPYILFQTGFFKNLTLAIKPYIGEILYFLTKIPIENPGS